MSKYKELIEIIKKEEDLEEFLTHESDYDYLYNFSKIRQNVLEWYDFDPKGSLLEIGAECGALTGLFCERLAKVVAVDEDEEKCEVNRVRNGRYNNLEVVRIESSEASEMKRVLALENNNDNKKKGDFDYITIIGVVTEDKLKLAEKYIKQGGCLIVATDNKYGIKSWTTDGLVGQNYKKLLSKETLKVLLSQSGFYVKETYYPIPDYVFPLEIYSNDAIPSKGLVNADMPSYKKTKIQLIDETKVMDEVLEDGKIDEFVNSYLLICER